ncbi:Rubrerythrin [Trichormus variabilis ATCC 29413]|uniref:Rubrerythrin n=2 Tax=Anabaena variabilis TaxID=264691 RepID=Q3M4R4_TRIV2|nr:MULTISPECIES: rubrerythrin family protein [Nostocaceae]ABA24022.1 Rubrerythrin [Trichormus variabilis ATCC 29413]MBC1216394.1 rubrerythrin family protein [Trichormus variabilis ARAD]MBC1253853.1 rubrerythrin family protein [Trichormus variabilis V5]MBC1267361.1 rubrerythrin family protein [Trichormus variabilis FSR]MBC1300697.1 rubrerythrin family protein [Trichormus variabilis N2B]
MDLSNFTTLQNLEAAFGGESMANRKYLFFAEVARKLGFTDLAKLFRETAEQETEHAFAHFELLHPELVVENPSALTDEQKREIVSRCLSLAIEGETYEYTTMYPDFAAAAQSDRDHPAAEEFLKQAQESSEHASTFREAAHRFGLLKFIENYHADRYTEALEVLNGGQPVTRVVGEDPNTRKWICRQCSMIYDPVAGDPDSGIAPGTPFEDIPDDWQCPICGATKKTFKLLEEKTAA